MRRKEKHRLIVDTNLWISFLLTKNFSKLDVLFQEDNITLLFSRELLEEFIQVVQRPKLAKYISLDDLQDILEKIQATATMVIVTIQTEICRDPKDNFLLSLAKDGRATHLLTGDADLLVLKKHGKTKIQTITEYLSNN